MNSCHPQDTTEHHKASDLAFRLPYRAAGQPSERPDTPRYTGGSITGNITGRPTRPAFTMPAPRKGRAAACAAHVAAALGKPTR